MRTVITISREFGSGGRSIGKVVADRLGYRFFDRELIEKIADETGLSKDFIEKNGEHSHGTNIFSYAFVGRNAAGQSMEDYLWKKQRDIILKLAEEGGCVIVGRCADYILRERKDCLHVFIHADKQSRMERIVNLYGETDQKPEKRLRDKDKARAANYKYYTERSWGDPRNYHISLSASELGLERCEDMIVKLAREL